MLTFGNPAFLFGLSATAIPVVLHFIGRRKQNTVLFSTLRFLTLSHRKTSTRFRLIELFLLLIRILTIALIALAFAKPTLSFPSKLSLVEKADNICILIDSSLSMRLEEKGVINFEKAKGSAEEIIAKTSPDAVISVIFFSDRVESAISATRDKQSLLQFIKKQNCGYGTSNISVGLNKAINTAEINGSGEIVIIIITDMQKNSFTGNIPAVPSNAKIIFMDTVLPKKFINSAVRGIRFEPAFSVRNVKSDVIVDAKNFGNSAYNGAIKFFLNGIEKVSAGTSIKPLQDKTESLQVVSSDSGFLQIKVSLSGDFLDADNEYFAVRETIDKIPVLCVGENATGNPYNDENLFLTSAINPSPEYPYSAKTIRKDSFFSENLMDYVFVMFGSYALDNESSKKLVSYVESGGNALVFLGENTNVNLFNRTFKDIYEIPGASEKKTKLFAKYDRSSRIFSIYNNPKYDNLNEVFIKKHFLLKADTSSKILASSGDGTPSIIARKLKAGNLLLINSSLNPESSNFAIHNSFPILLERILSQSAEIKYAERKNFMVGENIDLRKIDGGLGRNLIVTNPLGKTYRINSPVFENAIMPGIYSVLESTTKTKSFFAVNTSITESDLRRISDAEIAGLFAGKLYSIGDADKGFVSPRRNLWGYMLFAALLLIGLETFLSKPPD